MDKHKIFFSNRREAELPTDDFSDLMGVGVSREAAGREEKAKKGFLPSQLFDLSNLSLEPSAKPHPQIPQQAPASLSGGASNRQKGPMKDMILCIKFQIKLRKWGRGSRRTLATVPYLLFYAKVDSIYFQDQSRPR